MFKRTAEHTIELPDLGLVVAFGDVVDIPDAFFANAAQAAALGFTPVKSKPAAAPAADTQE